VISWRRGAWLLWPLGLAGLGVVAETSGIFPDLRFAVHRRPADMPSTRLAPPAELAAGHPLLSIAVDPDDLLDPQRGLLVHPMERGREWERFGYASFFSEGRLLFASGAGLRIHGGRSRVGSEKKSFSLRFRRRYGDPKAPAELFFGDPPSLLARLIVHNDLRQDRAGRRWHFVNPLAYDIASRIGAITPRTLPARFVLNGEPQGVYVLTEPIDAAFFEARFGHPDFDIEPSETSTRLRHWAVNTEPFTMEAVSARVDLQNLTRWVISILFCGATDIWQGTLARDRRAPNEQWFWVAWDLDHSFMDLYQRASVPWEIDTFSSLLGKPDARSRIFGRLLEKDARYRDYFVQRVTDALNHLITPGFLSERVNHYRMIAGVYRLADQEFLEGAERFLTERPAEVRRLVQEYAGAGPVFTVRVRSSSKAPLKVDGYPTDGSYEGRYFLNSRLSIEVPAGARSRFLGWTVNGVAAGAEPALTLSVTAPLEITARFSND
jgi:hypothetical protein